jgi:hypothetical protein
MYSNRILLLFHFENIIEEGCHNLVPMSCSWMQGSIVHHTCRLFRVLDEKQKHQTYIKTQHCGSKCSSSHVYIKKKTEFNCMPLRNISKWYTLIKLCKVTNDEQSIIIITFHVWSFLLKCGKSGNVSPYLIPHACTCIWKYSKIFDISCCIYKRAHICALGMLVPLP